MHNRFNSTSAFTASSTTLPPLNSERLLIESELFSDFDQALVISPGRAQFASYAAQIRPEASIDCWFLDLHNYKLAADQFRTLPASSNVQVICAPDLPERNYQLVVMPVLKRSEGELTRDLMQQAYLRLDEGGLLAMAVDNPNDSWLYQQMKVMFRSIHVQRHKIGTVYLARKRGDLKRIRNFKCEFVFRDQGQLIHMISEPGVFSHRRLDPGSRQLLNICGIDDGDRVLDLGCGAGGIALAAGFSTTAQVVGIDCNARAIRCLEAGAERNGLNHVTGLLDATGELRNNHQFEIVLANPPYFGHHEISKHFVDTAHRYLVSGGALLLVTKQPSWFETYMAPNFEDFETIPSGNYHVVCGRKP